MKLVKTTLAVAISVSMACAECNSQQTPSVTTKRNPSKCAMPKTGGEQTYKRWLVSSERNQMDNNVTSSAMTLSSGAELIFRCTGADLVADPTCRKGHLEAYVNTHEMIARDIPVRVRFDSGSPSTQSWSRSENAEAVFAPNARQLVVWVLKSKEFYLEYHPYQELAKTVTIPVDGLITALQAKSMEDYLERLTPEKVMKACGRIEGRLTYPPSNDENLGITFDFDPEGKLTQISTIGIHQGDTREWVWSRNYLEATDTAYKLVTNSPGISDSWKAEQIKR